MSRKEIKVSIYNVWILRLNLTYMKTKYRIQSKNKFRLTKIRKPFLKPHHAKTKSKTKTNNKKKSSKTVKSKSNNLRWEDSQSFQRYKIFIITSIIQYFRFKLSRNFQRQKLLSNDQIRQFLFSHQRKKQLSLCQCHPLWFSSDSTWWFFKSYVWYFIFKLSQNTLNRSFSLC